MEASDDLKQGCLSLHGWANPKNESDLHDTHLVGVVWTRTHLAQQAYRRQIHLRPLDQSVVLSAGPGGLWRAVGDAGRRAAMDPDPEVSELASGSADTSINTKHQFQTSLFTGPA